LSTTQASPLGDATVAELEAAVHGAVIRPGDDLYDDARQIWNGAHDRRPALIVRPTGAADVVRAMELGRSEGLPIAVRGGGHSVPGFSVCDDGLVIDLSGMRGVRVDASARRAVAAGGATWGDFDHETQGYGLATTGGLVSTTGIAGFTLGGGIGWLMRKHGLACDNLVGADVVCADGRIVHASPDEHPDLLWALKGGGGNFGVVTHFELELHPVGPIVYGGPIFFPGDRAAEVLRFYREWTADAPDELTTAANLLTGPPAPFLPEEWHGRRLIGILVAWAGRMEDGEGAVRALRGLGDPVADLCGPIPYTALQSLIDPLYPKGIVAYMKSGFMDGLDDDVIDELCRRHQGMTSPQEEIHVHHMGGAVGRVEQGASPFPDRASPYTLNTLACAPTVDGFEEHVAWAGDLYAALEPHMSGRVYVNFLGQGDPRGASDAYQPETFARLQRVKAQYDPENVFALNQNIPPAG
jgi:FAD/FMN-containing dehydrogenase